MIRVLVADDHALFRQGLCRLLELEEGIEVVSSALDGGQVIPLLEKYTPDVLLLDINMPRVNGNEVMAEIKERALGVKVIVLTIHNDQEYVFDMLQKGVSGYLLKDVEPALLVEAIRKVVKGESFIDTTVAPAVIDEFGRLATIAATSQLETHVGLNNSGPLTDREYEVLCEIAKGLHNDQIAERLFISEKTVKNHITSIYRKLQVQDRTSAVLKAVRLGLVSI